MTYKILKGEELGFEYLKKIMDIDEEVYSDLGMEGEELGFNYLQKIIDIDEEVYSDLGMEGARIL